MHSQDSTGETAPYPAHRYGHRWDGGHLFSAACALMATILSIAMFNIQPLHGLAAGAVALLFWAAFTHGVAEKRRMYVRVDRTGIELGRLRSFSRVEWKAIDDIRLTYSSSGSRDAIVIVLRDRNMRDIWVTDRWDTPIEDIFKRMMSIWKRSIQAQSHQ